MKLVNPKLKIIPDVENKVTSGNEEFPGDTQDTKNQIEMDLSIPNHLDNLLFLSSRFSYESCIVLMRNADQQL